MQLLDAVLAFALTLAALATVVTILMEFGHRLALMRKKNLVDMMKLLNQELIERFGEGPLKLSADDRWAFISGVIRNPASGLALPVLKGLKDKTLEDVLAGLRRGKLPKQAAGQAPAGDPRQGIYDKVTLEHVLRRLADLKPIAAQIEEIDDWSQEQGKKLKAELDRFARKYEEFGSAVSANFKRNAQFWSFVVGVGLAVVANIDGYRVFLAFKDDQTLSARVIAQQQDFAEREQSINAAIGKREAAVAAFEEARQKLDAERGKKSPDEQALAKLSADMEQKATALAKLTGVEPAREALSIATTTLDDLTSLGLPIGAAYFPFCGLPGSVHRDAPSCEGPLWRPGIEPEDRAARRTFLVALVPWLFSVFVTGALIGLGAPFWFDVAKRLAQVRQAFQGGGSGETRMSAKDSDGTEENRARIIGGIVAETPPAPPDDATAGPAAAR